MFISYNICGIYEYIFLNASFLREGEVFVFSLKSRIPSPLISCEISTISPNFDRKIRKIGPKNSSLEIQNAKERQILLCLI